MCTKACFRQKSEITSKTYLSGVTKVLDMLSLVKADMSAHKNENHLLVSQKLSCKYDESTDSVRAACQYVFGPHRWELSGFWTAVSPKHPDFHVLLAILLLRGDILPKFKVISKRLKFDVDSTDFIFLKTIKPLAALYTFLKQNNIETKAAVIACKKNAAFRTAILDCVKDTHLDKLAPKLNSIFEP